jgi:formylglycine-generating enzyme required for sulfatase activity
MWLWRSAILALWSLTSGVLATNRVNAGDTQDESQGYDDKAYPDPNEEDYPGMIYVGKLLYTGGEDDDVDGATTRQPREGFGTDNMVRYVFGTAFDYEHASVEEHYLLHHPHDDDGQELHDVADRAHGLAQARERHRHRQHVATEPKPFGHVDTNPVDGGVTPPRIVRVDPFFLDARLVTNRDFGKFVAATLYETDAEHFGWSFVLESFLGGQQQQRQQQQPPNDDDDDDDKEVDPEAEHWVAVPKAYWRQPEGPGSSYKFREHHPVVHMSHADAAAYCAWKGKRLPGEWEWEAAARAIPGYFDPQLLDAEEDAAPRLPAATNHSLYHRTLYAWGDEDDWTMAAQYANLWGVANFPWENDAVDGWRGTSPVGNYPANAAGFYDLTGNVWEWMRGGKHASRIVRGASFVDSLDGSVNHAATLGARSTIHGTTTTANVGFRCAKSPQRRVEHHYTWHDEEEHGTLAVEDQFGRRDMIPQRGWEDRFVVQDDEFDDTADSLPDTQTGRPRTKKKKVVKKRERLSNEL